MNANRPSSELAKTSLALLYSISRELTAELDLRELLKRVLQLTLETVGAPRGSILVLDEDRSVIDGALALKGRVFDHTAQQLTDTLDRGLAGWVVDNRESVLVPNTLEDERWLLREQSERDKVPRSAVCVPLIARDRVVGTLTIVHPEPDHLNKDHLSLLTAIADQAGIAVENARLFQAEQQRRNISLTLQEIARSINSTLDPARVFPQILEQLKRVVAFDSASILVKEDDHLRLMAAIGFDDNESIVGLQIPAAPNVLNGQVLTTSKPLLRDDVQQDEGWLKDDRLPEAQNIHGWIGAPLLVRDRAVGVLNVDSREIGAYRHEDVEVVSAFADQAATAIANAQLFAEVQRRAQAMISLAETARVVTGTLNVDEVLHRILRQTRDTLTVEAASLALYDEERDCLTYEVAIGRGADEIVGLSLQKGEGIAGQVFENEKPLWVSDVQSHPHFFREMDEKLGFTTRAMACVPIRIAGKTTGVLQAINPRGEDFSQEQFDLFLGIAGLAGTAIAHAKLFAETQGARRRYTSLFEDSVDPILITDLQGNIVDANHRAMSFLHRDRDTLLQQSILAVHKADEKVLGADELLSSENTLSLQSEAYPLGGRSIPVEVYAKRIELSDGPFIQWIMRDISERLELDELRDDLTSMIFHDLRSPLGNVISSLEVMQLGLPDDDQMHSVLSIAYRSSRRASRLVESLLDLTRLEAGKAVLNKTKSSMSTLIAEAMEEVHPTADAKGQVLLFDLEPDLPPVDIDEGMIRRVLINLVENASKYTHGQGEIRVTARRKDDAILISVSDQGLGIPKAEQDRIFEKFTRIQAESRPKGLGLGLAFCRLAVEAHSGKIWVESEESRGSTFYFTLPL